MLNDKTSNGTGNNVNLILNVIILICALCLVFCTIYNIIPLRIIIPSLYTASGKEIIDFVKLIVSILIISLWLIGKISYQIKNSRTFNIHRVIKQIDFSECILFLFCLYSIFVFIKVHIGTGYR